MHKCSTIILVILVYLDSKFPWFIVYIVSRAKLHERLPILVSSIVAECVKFYIGFKVKIVMPIVNGSADDSLHSHYWKSSYDVLHFQQ